MKKSPLLLALLILSAPLLLKQKLVAAETLESQDTSKRKQVTELIKEYFTCGPDCPKKYKDALVAQIARIRNINKKKALALVVATFLAYKGLQSYRKKRREYKLFPKSALENALRKAAQQR